MSQFIDNNRFKAEWFWKMLKIADHILIISPEPADIDSLCSCLLLHELLSHRGMGIPRPHILFCQQIPSLNDNQLLKFLETDLPLFVTKISHLVPEYIIFVDYGNLSTCGLTPKDFSKNHYFMGLDHHSEPANDFPQDNSLQLVNPDAPSTTALIYELFCHKGFPINEKIATLVALGIMADTGRLTNYRTNADALKIMADCIKKGLPWEEIQEAARPKMTRERIHVWAKAEKDLNFLNPQVVSLVVYKRMMAEWAGTKKDIETFFGTAISALEGVDLAILIFEESDGSWKISFRSNNPQTYSAAELAKVFNGGGHHHAAAAVYYGDPFDAERMIILHLEKTKRA